MYIFVLDCTRLFTVVYNSWFPLDAQGQVEKDYNKSLSNIYVMMNEYNNRGHNSILNECAA